MKRPIAIVFARIIVMIPTLIIILIGYLSVNSLYQGLNHERAHLRIQNSFYLSIHEFFGWEHSDENTLKAMIVAIIVIGILAIYITLYWQSGKRGNFLKVLTWTAATFVVSFLMTFWFHHLGFYFIFASTIMLGLFLLPSSRNYYQNITNDFDENEDILDTNI